MLSNTKIHGFGLVKWCKELIVDLYNLFVYILIHQQRSGHRTAINHDILFCLTWFKHIYVRYKIPPSNSLHFCIVFSVEYLQRTWKSKCFRISSRNILRIFFSRIRLCGFFCDDSDIKDVILHMYASTKLESLDIPVFVRHVVVCSDTPIYGWLLLS